jgi:hypothetical protein
MYKETLVLLMVEGLRGGDASEGGEEKMSTIIIMKTYLPLLSITSPPFFLLDIVY